MSSGPEEKLGCTIAHTRKHDREGGRRCRIRYATIAIVSPASPTSVDAPGIPIPPPLYYVAGFLIGVVLELAIGVDGFPTAVAIVGGALGVTIWLALDGAAMIRFRAAGTSMVPDAPTTALVCSGPYRLTRNPMYVGMAALYAGLALATGVVLALALLPVVLVAVDRLVIAREERFLIRHFGDEYRAYQSRVRRWI